MSKIHFGELVLVSRKLLHIAVVYICLLFVQDMAIKEMLQLIADGAEA